MLSKKTEPVNSTPLSMKKILEAVHFNSGNGNHDNAIRRLSDGVYEHILSELVFPDDTNELGIGEKITETQIASNLKMSNGPVRDAMARLRREGWIVTLHNRGSYIVDLTQPERSREIYDFRITVEIGAFHKLAKTITDAQLAELKAYLIMTQNAMSEDNLLAYRKADAGFHLKIIEMAGGQSLRDAVTPKLLQWFALSRCVLKNTFKDDRSALVRAVSHRDLYECLENHDCITASDMIANHCQYIAKLLGIEN